MNLLPMKTVWLSALALLAARDISCALDAPDPSSSLGRPLVGTITYPAQVTPITGIDEGLQTVTVNISAAADDLEIRNARIFQEPLVPMAGQATTQENGALGPVLNAYANSNDKENVSGFDGFLAAYPQSRWRAAIQVNLGVARRKMGYFTEALGRLEDAWACSKTAIDPDQMALANRAIGELADLNARFGRFERMKQIFDEIAGRDIPGSPQTLLDGARQGYWMMTKKPDEGFRCGPFAVNAVLNSVRKTRIPNLMADRMPSTETGTSLEQLHTLADEIGLSCQPALKSIGGKWVVPSVVHWRVGHFAAITARRDGKYLVKDATFGGEIWVTQQALDSEASGYALMPVVKGKLPAGWTAISGEAASDVWGKGGANTADPNANGNNKTIPDCPPVERMGQWKMFKMLATLMIWDSPVGYTPPFGREMNFTVYFKHLEAGQPATFNYTNFGPFWESNWISYATVDGGGTVTVELRGGGSEVYNASDYDALTSQFGRSLYSGAILRKTGDNRYERMTSDGARDIYSQPDGTGRIFLKQVIDPQGNQAVLNYDANLRLTSLVDGLGQSSTVTYKSNTVGAAGYYKVYRVTDPFGRYAEFTYDTGLLHLIKIRDVIGIETSVTYGDNGFVTMMTTPYGNTEFSEYVPAGDGTGRGLLVTLPDGSRECIERYRQEDKISYYWNRKAMALAPGDRNNAEQTRWLINDDHIMMDVAEWIKPALEAKTEYTYPDETFPGLVPHVGSFNLPSQVKRTIEGGDQIEFFEYNRLGQVTKRVDALGRTFSFFYSPNGIDLLEVRQTKGGANDILAKLTYNAAHQPLTAINPSGGKTILTYNTRGQLLTISNPKSEVTTVTYDGNGYLTQIDGPLAGTNDRVEFGYDSYGRLFSRKSVQGPNSADQHIVTYEYDALDRMKKAIYPDGTYEQVLYDRLDMLGTRDRLGRWTRNVYNGLGELVQQRDPANRTIQYEWCRCGALQKLTDALGKQTNWTYDVQGRLTKKTYTDTSHQDYAYETLSGRRTRFTDPLGNRCDFAYNLDNRIAGVSFSAGTGAVAVSPVSYTYDANYPRLSSVGNGYGTYTHTYKAYATDFFGAAVNGRGQVDSITNSALTNSTISYAYDELGRQVDRQIDGVANESTWSFDSAGRVSAWTNVLGTFTPSYVNASYGTSRLSGVALPNGVNTSFQWENNTGDFRLKQIKNVDGSATTLSQFDYVTDAVGQIAQWTQTAERYDFDYDPVEELTGAVLRDTSTSSVLKQYYYGYDAAGNRTGEQIDSVQRTAAFNSLNQMTGQSAGGPTQIRGTLNEPSTVKLNGTAAVMSAGGTKFDGLVNLSVGANTVTVEAKDANNNTRTNSYSVTVPSGGTQTLTYDAAGNMTSDGSTAYTWDALNRLATISYATGMKSEFTYDAFGRRVKIVEKDNGGSVTDTRLFIWDGLQMAERRDTGNAVVRRYFGEGYQDVAGSVSYYYTKDHLGSIREVTNSSGGVAARYSYDPYGRTAKLSGTIDSEFLYTGHYYHIPSALHLAPFRNYDPKFGRWQSRDPIEEGGGFNLYAYVENKPIVSIDPLGLWQFTFSFGGGVGVQISFGLNGGQVNGKISAGFAAGLSGSVDAGDSGRRTPGFCPITVAGTLGAGLFGAGAEAGANPDGMYGSIAGRAGPAQSGIGVTVASPGAPPKYIPAGGYSNLGATYFLGPGYQFQF